MPYRACCHLPAGDRATRRGRACGATPHARVPPSDRRPVPPRSGRPTGGAPRPSAPRPGGLRRPPAAAGRRRRAEVTRRGCGGPPPGTAPPERAGPDRTGRAPRRTGSPTPARSCGDTPGDQLYSPAPRQLHMPGDHDRGHDPFMHRLRQPPRLRHRDLVSRAVGGAHVQALLAPRAALDRVPRQADASGQVERVIGGDDVSAVGGPGVGEHPIPPLDHDVGGQAARTERQLHGSTVCPAVRSGGGRGNPGPRAWAVRGVTAAGARTASARAEPLPRPLEGATQPSEGVSGTARPAMRAHRGPNGAWPVIRPGRGGEGASSQSR